MRGKAIVRTATITATAALLAVAAGARAAENQIKCQRLDAPDGARRVMVAPDISFNGVPMEITELHWDQPPAAVLDYYRAKWKGYRAGVHEQEMPQWQVLSTVHERCIYSVQVRPEGNNGSYALLGVTRLLERGARTYRGQGFPMLPGSRVVNDIENHDGGKNARTVMLVNDSTLQANVVFYRNQYSWSGWQTVVDRAVPAKNGEMNILVMQRGPQQASLTIAHSGGSVTVVANVVDGR